MDKPGKNLKGGQVEEIFRGVERTISRPVKFQGIGLHKGKMVTMTLRPAPPRQGVVFKRVDLPGKPLIAAGPGLVVSTQRSTNLGRNGITVYTVEHIMAAVRGMGIDNLVIELDSAEPPVGDGSALPFARLIKEAGIEEQGISRKVIKIKEPLLVREGEAKVLLLPFDGFRASYLLDYPETLGTQYVWLEFPEEADVFLEEVAPARTFGFAKEVRELQARGLALGGSLDNAVLFDEKAPVNALRFENEPARHKLLDLLGDLGLLGFIRGEAIGIKSGHTLNARMTVLIQDLLRAE